MTIKGDAPRAHRGPLARRPVLRARDQRRLSVNVPCAVVARPPLAGRKRADAVIARRAARRRSWRPARVKRTVTDARPAERRVSDPRAMTATLPETRHLIVIWPAAGKRTTCAICPRRARARASRRLRRLAIAAMEARTAAVRVSPALPAGGGAATPGPPRDGGPPPAPAPGAGVAPRAAGGGGGAAAPGGAGGAG